MTTNCNDCGNAISPRAKTCPHCGAPGPARGKLWRALAINVGIFLLGFLAGEYLDFGEGGGIILGIATLLIFGFLKLALNIWRAFQEGLKSKSTPTTDKP